MLINAYKNQPTFGATTNPFNNIIPIENISDSIQLLFYLK